MSSKKVVRKEVYASGVTVSWLCPDCNHVQSTILADGEITHTEEVAGWPTDYKTNVECERCGRPTSVILNG